ncbi:MAG: helix-hairpin-helix domain-containing protein [Maricaulis sp.]|nr:helix-hairpin-helix domain-containing protein [Maricaulis sp.]MDG2044508.1 helix-hairpin-helix domain-containing protein [Maricaulis sp.]
MFYLIWQMGFLLLIAFAGGLFAGWQIWSSTARSAEADEALAEVARLRKENENLARRVGEAESETAAIPANVTPPVTEAADSADTVTTPKPRTTISTGASSAKSATPTPSPVDYAEANPSVSDDLLAIKGLGPKAAAMLREGGINSYAQIAGWSPEDIARWDTKISGRGRITRDEWVKQAKKLG